MRTRDLRSPDRGNGEVGCGGTWGYSPHCPWKVKAHTALHGRPSRQGGGVFDSRRTKPVTVPSSFRGQDRALPVTYSVWARTLPVGNRFSSGGELHSSPFSSQFCSVEPEGSNSSPE